ncbi:DUF6204 family protein [Streptomyces albidochromogenes]|uniref:DUF6204 family protein n=1 Tax=Streptomyces albidochromogenes TaxID=329524 RepID=A0ABW6FH53_9ACTN
MTTEHTYRVIVRGTWDNLTDESRARLAAGADDHGLARMKFTPEGSLAYDAALRHFTYRFEVVSDAADGEEMAAAIAQDMARTALDDLGHGYRDLRSTATDQDTMKINRKGR